MCFAPKTRFGVTLPPIVHRSDIYSVANGIENTVLNSIINWYISCTFICLKVGPWSN